MKPAEGGSSLGTNRSSRQQAIRHRGSDPGSCAFLPPYALQPVAARQAKSGTQNGKYEGFGHAEPESPHRLVGVSEPAKDCR